MNPEKYKETLQIMADRYPDRDAKEAEAMSHFKGKTKEELREGFEKVTKEREEAVEEERILNSKRKQFHILASMAYAYSNEFVEGFDTYEEAYQKRGEYVVNGDPYEVLTIKDSWEYEKERGITIKPVDTPS